MQWQYKNTIWGLIYKKQTISQALFVRNNTVLTIYSILYLSILHVTHSTTQLFSYALTDNPPMRKRMLLPLAWVAEKQLQPHVARALFRRQQDGSNHPCAQAWQ